jgi:hypothetical protein
VIKQDRERERYEGVAEVGQCRQYAGSEMRAGAARLMVGVGVGAYIAVVGPASVSSSSGVVDPVPDREGQHAESQTSVRTKFIWRVFDRFVDLDDVL